LSKLCGICHFDSQPVSEEDAARVHADLRRPGYVAPEEHRGPGVLVGCAAGARAPRSQGLFESPERRVCAFDGRLDNRHDLLRETGAASGCPDSAIVLNLYQRKGVDGLRDAVGDWSCCIWDAGRAQIVLASDYAGIRPLYYHRNAGTIWWSTSLADLVRWTGVTELSDLYAGAFLLHGSAPGQTPYAGILPVNPGQAVVVSGDGIGKRDFWSLPIGQEIRYRDERQYEERLLELFREAVLSRIRQDTTVCAELSGGLDSSSVVCMADRLRKDMPGQLPELHTFSYTHENSPDERFFREVERHCDVHECHLQLWDYPAVAADPVGAAPVWWERRFQELSRRMAAAGSGVFLTGQFGDFIMGNSLDDTGQVTEWLVQGRLGKAAREAYAWARAMQVPVYPILWRSIREACSSWVPSASPHDSVGAIPFLREDSLVERLRTRVASDEQERFAGSALRQAPPGKRRRFRGVSEVLECRNLQTPEALQHVSFTHPFVDRPLVEFMLAIPSYVVCKPRQPRSLMRRAFSGLLPPLIANRKSKGAYTSTYNQALMPLAKEILTNPSRIEAVERGYVERDSAIRRLEKFTQGLECHEGQLRLLILFEFWLRSYAARQPAPVSPSAAAEWTPS